MFYRILGKIITLRPALITDRKSIFEWLTNSNLTHKMFGDPFYPDCPIPTWDDFIDGYPDYFFNNSQPLKGRCFVIELEEEPVGQINHDVITGSPKRTELDIWLKDEKFTKKGYGTDAIYTLCDFLAVEYKCKEFLIAPSKRNANAIKSYKKVGFRESAHIPEDFEPDYNDAVLMIKTV